MDDFRDVYILIECPVFSKGVQSCLTHVLRTDKHTMVLVLIQNMMSWLHCQEHILYTIAHLSRLSVSHDDRHALAVPLDNSHIKLYDLAGNRLAHLPRRGGQVGFRLARIYWCKQLMQGNSMIIAHFITPVLYQLQCTKCMLVLVIIIH